MLRWASTSITLAVIRGTEIYSSAGKDAEEFHRQARMEIKKEGSLSAAVSLLLNKLLPADKE